MRIFKALRGAPVAAGIAALALLAIAGAVMASGSSPPLKVCVAAKEGAGIRTPKGGVCKAGWTLTEVNKEGPGTVAYFAKSSGSAELSGETTLVSKVVPAGSYVVSARTWIVAYATSQARVGALCSLWDSAVGHPGEGAILDIGSWAALPGETTPGHAEGASTVDLQAKTTTEATSELNLTCRNTSNAGAGAKLQAEGSSITAVQATEIR
jgi:hypothetical protein